MARNSGMLHQRRRGSRVWNHSLMAREAFISAVGPGCENPGFAPRRKLLRAGTPINREQAPALRLMGMGSWLVAHLSGELLPKQGAGLFEEFFDLLLFWGRQGGVTGDERLHAIGGRLGAPRHLPAIQEFPLEHRGFEPMPAVVHGAEPEGAVEAEIIVEAGLGAGGAVFGGVGGRGKPVQDLPPAQSVAEGHVVITGEGVIQGDGSDDLFSLEMPDLGKDAQGLDLLKGWRFRIEPLPGADLLGQGEGGARLQGGVGYGGVGFFLPGGDPGRAAPPTPARKRGGGRGEGAGGLEVAGWRLQVGVGARPRGAGLLRAGAGAFGKGAGW